MRKDFFREYFTFTKKERTGIYTLLIIMLICFIIPFCFPVFTSHTLDDHDQFDKEISRLRMKEDSQTENKNNRSYQFKRAPHYNNSNIKANVSRRLFPFDPNTIGTKEWQMLGVRDKTIATIEKYISKGGHFYKADDISKIWGLTEEDKIALLPYVQIKDQRQARSFPQNNNTRSYGFKPYHKYEQQPFDINTADSATLDSLPGIGPRLAKRIITFRERLGGFTSVEQVGETYGLPDSTFLRIRSKLLIGKEVLNKINLNSCTLEQLKAHPYIRYALANSILQYRKQHGTFSELQDLKKIMIISDSIYYRISPYLTLK